MVGGKSLGSTCGRYVWGGEWREGWQEMVGEVLGEEGEGEEWLRSIEEKKGGVWMKRGLNEG